jgi:type III pantothenate kinase
MSYTLALDCGTSRLHWALTGANGIVSAHGAIPNQEIGTLGLREWQNLPRPMRIVGVNVSGEATRVRVEAQMVRWRVAPEWLVADAEAAGVRNSYTVPGQLGADRWAALIAARRRLASELFPVQCVVVNARTIVSIDALDGDGTFRGGFIVPGINSMLQSVASTSPNLRMPPGRYQPLPVNNPDALQTGAVHAICGAIELLRMTLRSGVTVPTCLISDGGVGEIAQHLTPPVQVVDNLVLEGVLALAETRPDLRR